MKIQILFTLLLLQFTSCYTFRGISIPPAANSFYVEQFIAFAPEAPPFLGQNLTEAIKDKFRSESRLVYSEVDPDLEFSGEITEFIISAEAPQAGQTTSFNRLTISVQIEYTNNLDETGGWEGSRRFSQFIDYPSDQNFIQVQDELINQINVLLLEKIFNAAFTSW